LTHTQPYQRDLGDGLVLKSVSDERDAHRVAEFDGVIHDPGVRDMARELILNHPDTKPEHWLYVEDTATSQIVSSICLIPWKLRYEDVELNAGEVGIVGTLESYRRRGLVRELFCRHAELLRQDSYDLSHIQGIPYFYRQFGYEYALPLEGGWRVDLHTVLNLDEGTCETLTFRQAETTGAAGEQDLQTLVRLYDAAAQDLSISVQRDESAWRYLLGPSRKTEMTAETWLIQRPDRTVAGYIRVAEYGFGEALILSEVSRLDADAARAVLRKLRSLAQQRNKPSIRLNVPANSSLVQTARHLGAHDLGTYAWQIHLPNVGQLLRKLGPIFERRIAASPYAGLTHNLRFGMYREAYELSFQEGKLAEVKSLGFYDGGDIRVPPFLAAPLLLGHRTWNELSHIHPDVSVNGRWRHLAEILLPRVDSFLYTIY
jgi:hypothetical protein